MFILQKKLKSILIVFSIVMVVMAGMTSSFGAYHDEDLMQKQELTWKK